MIEIPTNTKDNPVYIKNVERLFNDRIGKWTPKDLYITRIDNWFDEKWVKFSGTIMHETREKGIRGFQIRKQTRVFYQIRKDRITILTLFDSRQDPRKRPR